MPFYSLTVGKTIIIQNYNVTEWLVIW
jgi:hypothetical protein